MCSIYNIKFFIITIYIITNLYINILYRNILKLIKIIIYRIICILHSNIKYILYYLLKLFKLNKKRTKGYIYIVKNNTVYTSSFITYDKYIKSNSRKNIINILKNLGFDIIKEKEIFNKIYLCNEIFITKINCIKTIKYNKITKKFYYTELGFVSSELEYILNYLDK